METSDNAVLRDVGYYCRCQLQVNEPGRADLGLGISITAGGAKNNWFHAPVYSGAEWLKVYTGLRMV
jgi:hypothetical protein